MLIVGINPLTHSWEFLHIAMYMLHIMILAICRDPCFCAIQTYIITQDDLFSCALCMWCSLLVRTRMSLKDVIFCCNCQLPYLRNRASSTKMTFQDELRTHSFLLPTVLCMSFFIPPGTSFLLWYIWIL